MAETGETKNKLLIVEDDPGMQNQLKWALSDYELIFASDRESAIAEVRLHQPAVVLQDLGLPPDPDGVSEGMETLREILRLDSHTKVIVVTGHGDEGNAIKAVGLGAYDFYPKPLETDVLALIVKRAFHIHDLEQQNRALAVSNSRSPLEGFIATSEQMLKVCRLVEKIAPTVATTLILGESGTGKEVVARAIHRLSPRVDKKFVAINCAAIPENLLESELFGYEKGAFTGAAKTTPGKVELADGGTLFLDEIGDMPPPLQAKLLRFLQERTVERVGGREEIPVDVRVLCATNQNLEALTREGGFREDLYYRVSEITIKIPPVRDRDGEKSVLSRALLHRAAERHSKSVLGFSPEAVAAIENYDWPGNVREMENRINGAVIIGEDRQISAEDLGLSGKETELSINLRKVREEAEREAIVSALSISDHNISKAATLLGITRPTLYSMISKLNIRSPNDDMDDV